MVLKALDRRQPIKPWKAVTEALKWVLEHHNDARSPRVTLVALGLADGGNYQTAEQAMAENREFREIARLIAELKAKRIAVVVPAGNAFTKKPGMPFPAILPDTISVGGTKFVNCLQKKESMFVQQIPNAPCPIRIADYSQRLPNRQDTFNGTDVFAPAGPLISTGINGNKSSATLQGTSMSTALVSGSLLLMQEYMLGINKELPTVTQLKKWLRAGPPIVDRVLAAKFVHLDLYESLRRCRDFHLKSQFSRSKK